MTIKPSSKPIRVSLKSLQADLLGTQRLLLRNTRGFVRYQVLHRKFTMLASAENNQRVFVTNAGNYKRSFQHDNLALTIGYGLIASDGEVWRRERKLAQPAFDKELLVKVVQLTAELVQDVIVDWQQASDRHETVDVYADMLMLTMRIIGKALFSLDLKTTPNRFVDTARVAMELALLRNISPVVPPLWTPTALHRKHRRLVADVDRFVYGLIDQRLQNNEGYDDILSKLVQSYGDTAAELRAEIRDQLVTLFFAGFETTASALTWTLYVLSQNPEAEARFHQEIDAVLQGRVPGYEDADLLPYTYQVIQESIRLFPPVYTLTRHAVADDQLGDDSVDAGDNVLIPIHAIHRMAEYWESPEEFHPERFAAGELNETQRKAYCPFGGGQRKCMGANFAMLELLVAQAMIGQRFKLRVADGHPVVPTPAVTIYPKNGLYMIIEGR